MRGLYARHELHTARPSAMEHSKFMFIEAVSYGLVCFPTMHVSGSLQHSTCVWRLFVPECSFPIRRAEVDARPTSNFTCYKTASRAAFLPFLLSVSSPIFAFHVSYCCVGRGALWYQISRNAAPSPYSTQSRLHVSACFRGHHLDNLDTDSDLGSLEGDLHPGIWRVALSAYSYNKKFNELSQT